MASKEELKVEVKQVHATSLPPKARQESMSKRFYPTTRGNSFSYRFRGTPSGIQRTKSINVDSKTDDIEDGTGNNVKE
ncbi:hypothetical protein QVD17_21259 [Tagetes erecta]|uniref:Uncharacterized protein n=1 Tax=Tagetes erecta TaxID=13708 RepID=A0AAD8NYR5_TARER|nr:hypothetical protein QVD17_21259 [Tagetes erecta]